tara:strand:- start:436 stop:597 length:162 start_codon:yes stop_codon:yes gene_type:complete
MELKQTDQEQYYENNLYNIHYLIRDVLTHEDIIELKDFIDDQINERDIQPFIN